VSERRLSPGEVIAWRNCPREAARAHGPSFAIAMRVVRDEPGLLILYRGPGYPMRRRNSERIHVDGFRHQPVRRFLDGWHDLPDWSGRHVLLGMDPGGRHALSLFRDAVTDAVEFWYVDVIGPVTRRGLRLDFLEHGLDAVVAPDHANWHLKDDDELEWNVEHGVYTEAEAEELRAEAKRAVHELLDDPARYDAWLSWRPDPKWGPPSFPAGWDAL
jgi:hypothetical protein